MDATSGEAFRSSFILTHGNHSFVKQVDILISKNQALQTLCL